MTDELKPIRLNIGIHPEKDPALFQLFSSMSNRDVRARRLLNLATLGMYFEKTGMSLSLEHAALKQTLPIESNETISKKATIKGEGGIPTPKNIGVVIEPGELDILN